ncbi:MAG TPA: sigma 54-interacting transcriptional regulator, partial [Thermoanaerobaculia bacterium]|nr:sigma 54-interacting transcriptional regulator [Thermoanaerobaculia bacterium]
MSPASSGIRPAGKLLHPALLAPQGAPLAKAPLGDRQRVAVLLQSAALLSHLRRAGWRLAGDLAAGWVRDGELLCGVAVRPGAAREWGSPLRALLSSLFAAGGEVGRGGGRKAARELQELWGSEMVPLHPDHAVAEVLAAAPFLWEARFAQARQALAAGWERGDSVAPWLAGPEAVRRRLLARARTLTQLEQLLADAGARQLWEEESGADRGVTAVVPVRRRDAAPASPLSRSAAVGDSAAAPAWKLALRAGENAMARGEVAAVEEALAAARDALSDPRTAWRWYRLQALRAAALGGNDEALAASLEALRRGRRVLGRGEAAQLWDDVAAARLAGGDLAGAERAAAHAVLLLRSAAGSAGRRALRRLVEARLRRGRLVGVPEALAQARAGERQAAGARSPGDAPLRARLELVRGRPGAALQVCESALAEAFAAPVRGALAVLAARALGWLGRGEEARRLLTWPEAAPAKVLEAEELPALWAHAGERERAVAAADGPFSPLWEAVLAGSHPARGRWSELETLEPYRAARLIFDCERVTPGLVPVPWVRRAIATLRRIAADELAAQLEGRLTGPWEALYAHLAENTGEGGAHDRDGLHRLFAAAGGEGVWLAVRTAAGEQVLLSGPGGEEELVAPLGDGHLVLRAPRLDPVLKTFFRLLLRQLPAVCAAAAGQPVPGIVGESPALLAALARLPRLAQGEVPIIVLGESGTGKELVARQVHRLSPRAGGPFLPINCAALSESLLLSDLFGHAKGAFTGADRDRAGIFETARGGTVFLDEIGDLPLAAQGKLLRVLQEKEVRRLGESAPRNVDVRVVTATHRDLAAMVREKSFREDLYYRLRVAVVELPPLRERGGDVLLLAEHFLARTSRGRRPSRLSRAARDRLLAHRWPGNVRELENVLEVAAALADGGAIEPDHLQLPAARQVPGGTYHQQLESFRRRLVEETLRAAGGNRAEAARRLGLTRQAL